MDRLTRHAADGAVALQSAAADAEGVRPLNERRDDRAMSRLRRTLSWLPVACMLFAAAAAGQTQPDFSGRWVLVDPVDATTNIPRILIVQQPIVRTNVYGAPMAPAFLRITIERHFVDDIRTDTYQIGVEGGVVVGVSHGVAPKAPVPQTRFSVHWDSDRLVMETGNYSGPTREAGPYAE